MEFAPLTYVLALAAGAPSSLAPCVLPLIPIPAGSALLAHRLWGRWRPASACRTLPSACRWPRAGTLAGLDQGTLRVAAAAILVLLGILLLVPALQARLAGLASSLGNAGQGWLGRLAPQGMGGQFLVGLVLGVV
jgi:cytochrome c-type biogenesis protein